MAYFKSKLEYLEFEKDCIGLMDKQTRAENRLLYNITEEDLRLFYGNEYIPSKKKSAKKKKKKEKFNKEQVVEQLHLFEEIFDDEDNSFIKIFNKNTGEYFCYPVSVLLDEDKLYNILNSNRFKNKYDLMYSLNTFNNMFKFAQNNIFTLNSFAIDVDFREVKRLENKTPKQVLAMLEKVEFGKGVPTPNIVEYGNNIRLIYVLEKAYSTKNVNTLVSRICKTIGERLVDYGGKGQPITTFGRIIGSTNSKVNKTIKVTYLNTEKYNITYLKDSVLPPLPEWYAEYKQKTKRKPSRVIDLSVDFKARSRSTQYNLNRISDIFKIVEYFNGNVDGRRFLCFQVRNHAKLAGMSDDEAKDILRQLNNKFRYPLRWNVIEQDTRNVNKKQYYYKSETFLDYISIDAELEEVLELKAFLSQTEYKRRENIRVKAIQKAKYRNEEGLTKTQIKRRNQFIMIARMELDGMSYSAISKELGYKDHTPVIKKINRVYEIINYSEILEEVKSGCYADLEVAVG